MKLFGIRIRIHPTFVWLLLFMFLLGGSQTVVWTLIVFAFVVLHELSHSLVARAHGIPVADITLLPIGGVARLGHMPEHSATEFKIAIAGPLFNFAVVAVVYLLSAAVGVPLVRRVPEEPTAVFFTLPGMILVANLALGGFNLLPAFPMDGGRLLRAWLARTRGYLEATHIAARVGRWVAALMALYSLSTLFNPHTHWNWWLLLIAAFIYISGKREEMAMAASHAMRGLWNLFGFGDAGYEPGGFDPGAPPPFADEPDDEPDGRPGVIDVQGTVRPDPGSPPSKQIGAGESSPADAFRRLSEQARSRRTR